MIIQSPLLGHLSGTTGNIIAQTYHGKTHIRTKPIYYHYPATEDQQRTQAKFYDIQRQWNPIYRVIAGLYSPSQRKGKNVYNMLSTGIYEAFETFPETTPPPPPKFFGTEQNPTLSIIPKKPSISTTDKLITFDSMYAVLCRRANQENKSILVLLFNVAQQSMYLSVINQPTTKIHVEITNTYRWQLEDKLHTYCAIVRDKFVSNFFQFM